MIDLTLLMMTAVFCGLGTFMKCPRRSRLFGMIGTGLFFSSLFVLAFSH